MFTVRVFNGVRKFEKLHYSRHTSLRFLCTESAALSKDNEAGSRKFVKPLASKKSDFLKQSFLRSLFAGSVDRGIFEYPTVLRASDIDIALNHGFEVENFINNISRDQLSEETIKKLAELELFGLSVPQEYGGAGYNETECKFIQECTGVNPTVGRFLGYSENFGCKILQLYGSEEQKEKYLPRLAQGKSFVSLAYLEKGPLIDLTKIEGQAITDEVNNNYILKAEKKWVHDADKADLFFVVVKVAKFFDADAEVQVKFNFFIVDKNTPGVTVHRLKSEFAQENNLYDVSFNDVVVGQENVLGDFNVDGFEILKCALSHSNVTDAALCCNLLKRITHDVIGFIYERSLTDPSLNGHSLIQENLASLVSYLYALESVIYLITGRYDQYENPDLFYESIFAKTLAVEFLQIAIKKYIEVFGRESFKSSGLLEEAINTTQYYSVFEENIEYLKIFGSAEGMVAAASKLSQKVKILRNPFDNNWEAFKRGLTRGEKNVKQIQAKLNFKLELQESLQQAAELLDESYAIFLAGLEEIFISDGAQAMNNEYVVVKFGDMAAYIYACMACLSRASSSLCYDFSECKNEMRIAHAFSYITNSKIKQLYAEEVQHKNLGVLYKDLGKETFHRKEYPVEHPLSRTF